MSRRNYGITGITLALFSVSLMVAHNAHALCGDVSGNGEATAVDALMVLKYAVGQDVAMSCSCDTTPPSADTSVCEVGESGSTSFHNNSEGTVFLDGCSVYFLEKLEGEVWTDRGPAVVCVSEGVATPVEAGASVTSELVVYEAGQWRLRYPVGIGCDTDSPLRDENCDSISPVHTPSFTVQEQCDSQLE